MTTLTIFLLTLITLCLALCQCRKTCILFSVITIACFIGIGCGIFPLLTLNHLEFSDRTLTPKWAKNNAIILLGAGAVSLPGTNIVKPSVLAYSRINEAAKLYFSCKASGHQCSMIVSGGDASKTGKSEASVYQNELQSLGVKNTDLLLEQNSLNTYKNAEFTSNILKSKSFDNLLLVTSEIHMRRALLYFSHFGIYPTPAIADYMTPIISRIPIGYNFTISDFIIHEYLGIARFYIYNYLGWNARKI